MSVDDENVDADVGDCGERQTIYIYHRMTCGDAPNCSSTDLLPVSTDPKSEGSRTGRRRS